jgi:hypothetical protein
MTEAEINAIAARIYGTLVTEQEFRFARALLASKTAVPLTTEQIDAIRERFHADDMPSRGLVQRIAMLTAPAQSCGDAEQADEAVTDDVFDWLETEVTAISCRYHGYPSYDHDAYWMRDRVVKLIGEARNVFTARTKEQS